MRIRRDAFLAAGGFDGERFPHPSIEDVDLGARLVADGARIVLDPAIQGTHLKAWTLRSMVRTDFARRGVPWVALLLRSGQQREAGAGPAGSGHAGTSSAAAALNLGWRHRASAAACATGVAGVLLRRPLAAVAALLVLLGANRDFYVLLARRRGVAEAAAGVGLHAVHHLTALAAVPAGVAVHLRDRRRARDQQDGCQTRTDAAFAPGPTITGPGATWRSRRRRVGGRRRAERLVTGPVRIGLVGAGRLAEVGYLPAAAAARDVVVGGVAEPDPVRRDRIAALARGVPAFADAAALLAGTDVDALVLATPAAAHLGDARLGAVEGLPVLVEKPPAPDRAGAAELAALEPAPYVALNRRFDPAIAALRAATPTGAEVAVVAEIAYRRGGWGTHAVADDALLDLGPHLVDLARWITKADVTRVRRASVTPETGRVRPGARRRAGPDPLRDRPVAPRARRGPAPRRHGGRAPPRRRSGGRRARPAAHWTAPARRVAHRGARGVRPDSPGRPGSRARLRRGRRRRDGGARRGPRAGRPHSFGGLMLAVLQFDSPSLAVLDRMLDAGRLPALAGLRGRGVWHELETPATHFAAGAFHTLYSGTELAGTGCSTRSSGRRRTSGSARPPRSPPRRRCGSSQAGGRSRWTRTRAVRRCTPPSGTVVSGWQFTDRVVLQPWSSPPGLNARLETLFGPPAAVEEVFGRSSTRDLLRLRRDLLASSGRAADAAALLLAESKYDLTWLTFSAGHVAGHQFFDLSQLPERLPTPTPAACSAARWRRSTRASTPRSPACSPRCPRART